MLFLIELVAYRPADEHYWLSYHDWLEKSVLTIVINQSFKTTFPLYCQYIGEIKWLMSRDKKRTSYSLERGGEGVKEPVPNQKIIMLSDIDYFT